MDQTRLRRIVEEILAGEELGRAEVWAILEIARLSVGADGAVRAAEHAALEAIAQRVASLLGLESRQLSAIRLRGEPLERPSWFRSLAAELRSRHARELAFAMAFLVLVADLELSAVEHESLEDLQRALGVDDRRASDIVIRLTELLAS